MAKSRPFGGVYENMDFDTYEYREYPKHIRTGDNGRFEIVNDQEEEAVVLARLANKNTLIAAEQEAIGIDPVRERLLLRARELDVPVNRKWTIHKLQNVIYDAENTLDSLPAENYEDEKPSLEQIVELELPKPGVPVKRSNETRTSAEIEKERLYTRAKELGIPVNKLWGIPRLKAAIEAAEPRLKSE